MPAFTSTTYQRQVKPKGQTFLVINLNKYILFYHFPVNYDILKKFTTWRFFILISQVQIFSDNHSITYTGLKGAANGISIIF